MGRRGGRPRQLVLYLVWWVRVSLGVRVSGMIRVRVDVRARVSKLLGSD